MSAELRPGDNRLVWSLWHYAWVVLLCALAVAAVSLIFRPVSSEYQANALVYARQLTVDEQVLPRLGEAVFATTDVKARVATDPAVGGDTRGLIPERLSVVAAEDSVVLVVQARDPDPVTAARLATLGATVLSEELNRAGAGVGEFALHGESIVPTEPLSAPDPRLRATLGALAGAILGLGLIAMAAVVRHPVISSRDVEENAGVPLLGIVQLPALAQDEFPGPLGVQGIATVTRSLAALPSGRLLLVSPPSFGAIRQRVLVMAAVALGILRPVRAEAPHGVISAIQRRSLPYRRGGGTVDGSSGADGELVLVDGGSPMEMIDPTETTASVVAVAPLGISRHRLRVLATEYLETALVGIVLVDIRPGRQRSAARRARTASGPTVAGSIQRAGDVQQPERA